MNWWFLVRRAKRRADGMKARDEARARLDRLQAAQRSGDRNRVRYWAGVIGL